MQLGNVLNILQVYVII